MKLTVPAAFLACALALPLSAQANGVPTVDVTSIYKIAELIAEAKLQLKEMLTANLKLDAQTAKMLEQITVLKSQYDALTNGLSLASLGLTPNALLDQMLPDVRTISTSLDAARSGNWNGVLASKSVGGIPTAAAATKVFESAGLTKAEVNTLAKSANPTEARIGTAANTSAFLSVAAEASHEDAKDSMERLSLYAVKVGETKGLKEAIDLNTLATIELGNALANMWSMEAVQTVGMGEAGVMDAATAADEAKFLKVGKE